MATTTVNSNAIYYERRRRNPSYPLYPSTVITKKPSSLKCTNNSEPSTGVKGVLSGMVESSVEQLLKKEENKGLLDGLEKATLRVEIAKRELAEIQKQEIEAKQLRDYINQLQSRASEIAEIQKEIVEARAMVEEAERALAAGGGERNEGGGRKEEERIESIKAATISALAGTLVWLPISLTQLNPAEELILPPLGVTLLSCALFGVTFRYAVRRDLDDFHLKTGPSAAFAVVKGLATLDGGPPLELEVGSLVSHAVRGAVYVSENLLVFLFAAVALDFCYKSRFLSPFPITTTTSSPDNTTTNSYRSIPDSTKRIPTNASFCQPLHLQSAFEERPTP